MTIKPYTPNDKTALFNLIRSEGEEWGDYTRDEAAVARYCKAIDNSIVFVAFDGDTLCGFVRAKDDDGYGVYIHDLLVHKNHRGNSHGKALIEHVANHFEGNVVYVMSDVDEYYFKQGYTQIEGRILVVRKPQT